MSSSNDAVPLFAPEELAAAAAAAVEMRRELDEFAAQLQTPAAKAEAAALAKELVEMAEAIKRDCATEKYALSPSELEQLRRDGVFVKCHTRKRGVGSSD